MLSQKPIKLDFSPETDLSPNITAGLIVGVVALPLAMAFAIASGARPEQGLNTAIIGGALVSLFGGSRVQIAGPTGAFIVILSGITAKFGIDGLQVATLMAGFMLVLMGIARLGVVIKFIPSPVIVGFTAGIGVIIFVGEWRDFFGLPRVSGDHFHEKLWHLFKVMPQFHPATLVIALISLLLVIYSRRIWGISNLPCPLVAMVVATLIKVFFIFRGWQPSEACLEPFPKDCPISKCPIYRSHAPSFSWALRSR